MNTKHTRKILWVILFRWMSRVLESHEQKSFKVKFKAIWQKCQTEA